MTDFFTYLKSISHIIYYLILSIIVLNYFLILIFNLLLLKFPLKMRWYRKIIILLKGYRYVDDQNIIFQNSFFGCGIFSLKMILENFNINSTINEISSFVKFDYNEVNMLNLVKFANKKGLRAEGWKVNKKDFSKIRCPVLTLIYKKQNHWVVISRISNKDKEVIILDPALGRISINIDRFLKLWSGYIITFCLEN